MIEVQRPLKGEAYTDGPKQLVLIFPKWIFSGASRKIFTLSFTFSPDRDTPCVRVLSQIGRAASEISAKEHKNQENISRSTVLLSVYFVTEYPLWFDGFDLLSSF